MSNENYWPDITADESTKCVFELFETLKAQLKEKYDGKIQCHFEPIVYKVQGYAGAVEALQSMRKVLMASSEADAGVEEGKEQVSVEPPDEYKFLIYDERRFFRILDVKLGEYFPIQIRQSKGVSPNSDYEYVTVDSDAEFTRIVLDCINSTYVKDVIRYMLDSQE